jgi:competence/damage-inducible protein CinA-like protein
MGTNAYLFAEVITVGDELILGETIDTNATGIAVMLRDIGVPVRRMTTVGDRIEDIVDSVTKAVERCDLLIVAGGLGPTMDDITREGVALALSIPLNFSKLAEELIRERFKQLGREPASNNLRQALFPEGADIIPNPVGTAPAFSVRTGACRVYCVPGVPREMRYLMQHTVLPEVQQAVRLQAMAICTLRVAGIGESDLELRISKRLLKQTNPVIGFAAHHGIIDTRLTAYASNNEEAVQALGHMRSEILADIGPFVFGFDGDTVVGALQKLVEATGFRVGFFEDRGLQGAFRIDPSGADGNSWLQSHLVAGLEPAEIRKTHGLQSDNLTVTAPLIAAHLRARYDLDACGLVLSRAVTADAPDNEANTVAVVSVRNGETVVRQYGFGVDSPVGKEWIPNWVMGQMWYRLRTLQEGEFNPHR